MRAFFAFAVWAACGGGASRPPAKPVANTPPPPAAAPASPVESTSAAEPAPPPLPPLSSAPPPPLSDAEVASLMQQTIAMLTAFGAAVDAAGGDCGKTADGLEDVVAANLPLVERLNRYEDDPEVQRRGSQWVQGHIAEVVSATMKIAEAAQRCVDDPKFAEAMKRLDQLK